MIGSLRERVEIFRPLRNPDGGGGYELSYTPVATVPARAEGQRAVRDRSVGRELWRRRIRFMMRARDDLIFEMRLLHRGRFYRITDIQDADEKRRFALIQGEEVPG